MKNLNEISIEEIKGKRIYLAYGSNLNLKQMEERCPTAEVLGKGILKDYELIFRGRRKSAVATIEPLKNGKVPILLWTIEKTDEKSLDIYEGYPSFYRKEDIEKMAKFLQKIRFDKLQLNSLARRGTESWVKPASIECLKNVEKIFHENGIKNVEIIKEMKEIEKKLDIKKDLLENMKAKREYSEEEIEKIFKK